MATVTLDPSDLRPEYQIVKGRKVAQNIPTSDVNYFKLNKKAQNLVDIVGQATFYSRDRKTFTVVYSQFYPRQ